MFFIWKINFYNSQSKQSQTSSNTANSHIQISNYFVLLISLSFKTILQLRTIIFQKKLINRNQLSTIKFHKYPMFVTKQIINERLKKSALPHKRQILREIKASMQDETWKIDRFEIPSRPKSCKNRNPRPKTAITLKTSDYSSTSNNFRMSTQEKQQQRNGYIRKVNYQFNQINQITSLFDNLFDWKEKKSKQSNIYSEKVQSIKRKINQKQKEQKRHYQKNKRISADKTTQTEPNIYMGYSKEKVKKVIPISTAKYEDMNMISRYIKGGYVQQTDQFSQKVNKSELLKLKKRFITMNTLYDAIKGKKNKGIENLKPQSVDRSSFQNYVYFLQNERNLKIQDKLAIQQKIKIIS